MDKLEGLLNKEELVTKDGIKITAHTLLIQKKHQENQFIKALHFGKEDVLLLFHLGYLEQFSMLMVEL